MRGRGSTQQMPKIMEESAERLVRFLAVIIVGFLL